MNAIRAGRRRHGGGDPSRQWRARRAGRGAHVGAPGPGVSNRRIRRLLIANRGEIAVRLLRTCQRLGIETVLAASDADLDSAPRPPGRPGGPPRSGGVAGQLPVGRRCGGGGGVLGRRRRASGLRLSFGEPCAGGCLRERGPASSSARHPRSSRAVGDKLQARAEALAAGLPVLPGGEVTTLAGAERLLSEIGLPVLVKAVGGGGGRGMKKLTDAGALAETLELSMAEARGAFGDPRVYLERYLDRARHIEVQVLGDGEAGHPSRRPGLLGAAPLPETARGGAGAVPARRLATRSAHALRCNSPSTWVTGASARWSSSSTRTTRCSTSWR